MAAKARPRPEEQRRRAMMMGIVREEGITSVEEPYATLRDMFAGTMGGMLRAELDDHLGCNKHGQNEKTTNNRRNGRTKKSVRSREGGLEMPRDRDGGFEPKLVKKGQKDVGGIQGKAVPMHAKGLSGRDIGATIHGIRTGP